MKRRFSNWVWGTFMLLAATFIIANQFNGFVELSVGSLIAAALAVAFFVQCVAQKSVAPLPIPLAVLYIVFHETLGWPSMQAWALILAAVLAAIGLAALIPGKGGKGVCGVHFPGGSSEEPDGDWAEKARNIGETDDNNPVISASFTGMRRYIRADALETVRLSCSFGALEIYLDQATLSPNGAEVFCDCKFGAISLIVPKDWRVEDKLNCTLGGVDNKHRHYSPAEDAPRLTVLGDVSLGGIEIKYVV